MAGGRYCRVCGCTAGRRCAPGCNWASADRCLACQPPAVPRLPVSLRHLQAANYVEVSRERLGGGEILVMQMVEYPEVVQAVWRQPGHAPRIRLFFGDVELDSRDRVTLLRLLNQSIGPGARSWRS